MYKVTNELSNEIMKEVFHLRGESHKFPILALIYDNLFQWLLGKLTLYLSLSEFKKATKK